MAHEESHGRGPGEPVVSGVVMYSSRLCPYCHAAKRLLTARGISFEEIDVDLQPERRAEMIERAGGRRTVPQIFFGERHVGGCDDLYALDRDGALDTLIG